MKYQLRSESYSQPVLINCVLGVVFSVIMLTSFLKQCFWFSLTDINHVESFKNCESTENLGTGPAVGIAICVIIAIVSIVIGILVCKKKKRLCFKQTTPPQTTPPGENTELQDQNKNNRGKVW